jgi:hypothetical protein
MQLLCRTARAQTVRIAFVDTDNIETRALWVTARDRRRVLDIGGPFVWLQDCGADTELPTAGQIVTNDSSNKSTDQTGSKVALSILRRHEYIYYAPTK